MMNIRQNRREFLRRLIASSLLVASRGSFAADMPMSHGMVRPQASPDFDPDIDLELESMPEMLQMLPGEPTRVWRYRGRVLKGGEEALGYLDGSGHLPVIRARRGQRLRIRYTNRLMEPSIVHWHGLHIEQRMDGHPMYAIGNGESFVYEFVLNNRAGTYWFHPHPHERTAFQVYMGLTGLLLLSDEEEMAAGLPSGEQDLALVLQDRSFDPDNQLRHLGRMRHDWMMGFAGDTVLVNGAVDYSKRLGRRAYRLRLFNGSNASLYRLRLSGGRPFTVIATDGGLLERPLQRDSLTLAVAERVEVWLDLSGLEPGEEVQLLAETYTPSLDNISPQQNGAALTQWGRPLARFIVDQSPAVPGSLPARLSMHGVVDRNEAVNAASPRQVVMSMMMGSGRLNGRVYGAMDEVAADEVVKLGTSEIWEFANGAAMGGGPGGRGRGGMGMMGMQMAHPMHVHNVQFRILDRIQEGGEHPVSAMLREGFVDEGLKDVVLVLPGERVRVMMSFTDHAGIYLYHCHILEHEDSGMMRNFLIQA